MAVFTLSEVVKGPGVNHHGRQVQAGGVLVSEAQAHDAAAMPDEAGIRERGPGRPGGGRRGPRERRRPHLSRPQPDQRADGPPHVMAVSVIL